VRYGELVISKIIYVSGVPVTVDNTPATREEVRAKYAAAAQSAADPCCGTECCSTDAASDDFGAGLYRAEDVVAIPSGAADVSLGCGNPTALAELAEGETVLDLGSGGGIDVLLAAEKVGPSGFVYGLDMTDEMLALARKHAAEAGADNVDFLTGYIEDIPLEADTVDVIISNCVINLSSDKSQVLAEMFRVLRPGGRVAVSDVVAEDHLSPEERQERGSWVGCIAGALSFREYETGLRAAGFVDVSVTATHAVGDGMHSATIRATKP
jgi:SAM-dependent methyltransferase